MERQTYNLASSWVCPQTLTFLLVMQSLTLTINMSPLSKAFILLRDINVPLAENVIVPEQTGTRQEKQLLLRTPSKLGLLQLSSCLSLEKFYHLKQLKKLS